MVYFFLGGYSSNSHFIQDFCMVPPNETGLNGVDINPGLTLLYMDIDDFWDIPINSMVDLSMAM